MWYNEAILSTLQRRRIMAALCFLGISLLLRLFWPKFRPGTHWLCPVLALALPFCAGGFHTGTAAALCLVLVLALLEQLRKHKNFRLCLNPGSLALLAVFLAYAIAPLWAADKGMALFAIPHYLPLALLALVLMQEDLREPILDLIPLGGCLMTLLSLAVLCFPGLRDQVVVNGRLAGFFQYPNSFAAFLLAGLVYRILSGSKGSLPVCLILMAGIVLSGSKTTFVLMALSLAAILLLRRQKKLLLLIPALICALAIGLLANHLGLLAQADRFTRIEATSGTFLVRLLYYRDALPTILCHPFGIGYLGYPAIEGTIQTGRYAVTYIHNGLLQLLLDIGWAPTALLALVLLKAIGKNPAPRRFLLLAVLAHCMLDFDLQFAAIWVLILCCLDLTGGRCLTFSCTGLPALLAAALLLPSLWLGTGDWLYRQGMVDACLTLTPFHTEALATKLTAAQDAAQVDALADRILSLNPTHSPAWSAKANAALSRGDVVAMIRCKEEAIRLSPYTTAEYCDYFQKLYWALDQFLKMGDVESAAQCREKLLNIPAMMAEVSRRTSPLAYRTGDDPTLELPAEYTRILELLPHAF